MIENEKNDNFGQNFTKVMGENIETELVHNEQPRRGCERIFFDK
jgi:hypothetical protein